MSAGDETGVGYHLGVDVGGTFTDAVLSGPDGLFTTKVATTPEDQSRGVMTAVSAVLGEAGVQPGSVSGFAHGMTVATNALLEGRGARTALVATEGFADVIEIARQDRPDLYRPCRARPAPLVAPELRIEVAERTGPDGVLKPLPEDAGPELVARIRETGAEAVAVCLLHSYAHPGHEQRVSDLIRSALPTIHVSASCELLPVFREYERTSTTVIDAYLSPLLGRYLRRLSAEARRAGLPAPEIMRSSGGLMSASAAARNAAWTVLSGPAAGVVGAAHAGGQAGSEPLVTFDMGGTSCDVAVVDGGGGGAAASQEVAGRMLALPMVDVHTVGAGGGSLGWADPGGALRVGPRSAGADPGPACYGRGGTEPTVTDANLLLGYLGGDSTLAGEVALDRDAAERAVTGLGERLGLTAEESAWGIVRVADHEMGRAVRVVTVERGVDPRRHALLAFGGAGPMHALRIADDLGIGRVLCPRAAGVLSALGLVVSERRHDAARTVMLSDAELREGRAADAVRDLAAQASRSLPGARIEAVCDLRYQGQAHELPVDAPGDAGYEALREAFERAHADRYGYSDPDGDLELVTVRVAALQARDAPIARAAPRAPAPRSARRARFADGWMEAAILAGDPAAGEAIEGPAICELSEATVVVPPGWSGAVDPRGTMVLERA